MIMPNCLSAYSSKMSGAELKETVKNFVEGYEGGFIPFNRGSLPVFSGISVEVKETDDGYTLSKITKDGKKVQDNDTFTVICLAIPKHMKAYPADENIVFDEEDTAVEDPGQELYQMVMPFLQSLRIHDSEVRSMEIKNHNKDRKRTGMRKRFSIAAYLAVFACVVLLVFQYFGFISKTVYEESVSHLTEVFHQSITCYGNLQIRI